MACGAFCLETGWETATREALEADPRARRYGMLVGGTSPLDPAKVLMWFDSPTALMAYLRDHEPGCAGLEPPEAVAAWRARLHGLTARAAREGLSRDLLAAVRRAIEAVTAIEWWGRFDDLLHGQGRFPREARALYARACGEDIATPDPEDFVAWLVEQAVF